MAKENKIYDKLKATFSKEAYDTDGSRGFDLTTIGAYFVIERLNEVLGLCGKRWWLSDIEWIRFEGDKNMVICSASFCYVTSPDNELHKFPCVGGHQVIKNRWDDGYKSAMTNCICKGASFLGVGLDVYKGEFNGEIKEKKPTEKPKTETKTGTGKPTKKMIELLDKMKISHLKTESEIKTVIKAYSDFNLASKLIGEWIGTFEKGYKDGQHTFREAYAKAYGECKARDMKKPLKDVSKNMKGMWMQEILNHFDRYTQEELEVKLEEMET